MVMRRPSVDSPQAGCFGYFGYFLFFLFLSVQPIAVLSSLTNRTIDDQYGDEVSGLPPSYSYGWSQGANCTVCVVKPNASQAYRGTWHDTSYWITPGVPDSPRSVSLMFNGTAIYAYFIIANTVPNATTLTNLTFSLDGTTVGPPYIHNPNSTSDFEYNIPVYSNDLLPNGQHTLAIEAAGNYSFMLFDYATYTFDSDPIRPRPAHSSHLASILGGAIGGLVFAGFVLVAFILFRRRRAHRNSNNMQSDDANLGGPSTSRTHNSAAALTPYTYSPLLSSNVILASTPPKQLISLPIAEVLSSTDYRRDVGTDTGGANAANRGEEANPPVNSDHRRADPSNRSKAARRQEELAREIREREQIVADLQRRHTSSPTASNTIPSSGLRPYDDRPPSIDGPGDVNLRDQIGALHLEVERLRTEQNHILREMDNAPPPEYEEVRPLPPSSRGEE